MSRAQFLRLRKAASERQPPKEILQAKVITEEEKQEAADSAPKPELHPSADSELLNEAPDDLKTQAKYQFELMFPERKQNNAEKLGMELEKFFTESPGQDAVSSQQKQKSEFEADLKPPRGTPGPELTTDGLHYKITQMAKAIVDQTRVQESLKSLTGKGIC